MEACNFVCAVRTMEVVKHSSLKSQLQYFRQFPGMAWHIRGNMCAVHSELWQPWSCTMQSLRDTPEVPFTLTLINFLSLHVQNNFYYDQSFHNPTFDSTISYESKIHSLEAERHAIMKLLVNEQVLNKEKRRHCTVAQILTKHSLKGS